jgi:AAA+ ATPase superfamily predicted ATPase
MDLLNNELEGIDIEDVINLFYPAIEITDAVHFAGRRTEIEECTEGLLQKGALIVLYGQRGVGKTSIANQIYNIANNNVSLLKKLRITHLIPKRGFKFRVLKYELDTSVKDIHDLIGRIVYGDKVNNGLLSLVQDGSKKQIKEADELELSGDGGIKGFFNIKGGEKVKKEYEIDDTSDLIIKFKRLLNAIESNDSTGNKLLLTQVSEFKIGQIITRSLINCVPIAW